MSELAPASIGKLLKEDQSALQRIFVKVQQLNQLNNVLLQCLDPQLRHHCIVANVYPDKLVVLAENGAFATQFRFSIPELLTQLRKKHPLLRELKTIECKVKV